MNAPRMAVPLGSLVMRLHRWYWSEQHQEWNLRLTRWGRSKATVWPNGIWHTWDQDGNGGENSECQYAKFMEFENRHFAAKREAWDACIRQGFFFAHNTSLHGRTPAQGGQQ